MRRAPFGDPVVPLVYWMSARSSVSSAIIAYLSERCCPAARIDAGFHCLRDALCDCEGKGMLWSLAGSFSLLETSPGARALPVYAAAKASLASRLRYGGTVYGIPVPYRTSSRNPRPFSELDQRIIARVLTTTTKTLHKQPDS